MSEAEAHDLARRIAERDAKLDRERGALPAEPPPLAAAPEPLVEDWSWLPPGSAAHEIKDPTIKTVVGYLEPLVETIGRLADAIGKLKAENASLRVMVAEMRGEHAETKARLGETAHKLDRLTITHKGDPGERGATGADGREGRPGAQGPKGNRGQKGFNVAAWEVDAAEYCIVPVFGDDTRGPAANLRALFERYAVETGDDDVAFEAEQAAHSRAQLEVEVARTRIR